MRLKLCVACGDTNPDHLQHHHLVPRSREGSDDETNLITLCVACHGKLHGVEWNNDHRSLTRTALARAKCRGVRLGGRREQSDITKREAAERAEALRSVFEELSGLSARKVAEELNRRGIPTVVGGKWYATQVIRVRRRL
jgi:hypothetical protein